MGYLQVDNLHLHQTHVNTSLQQMVISAKNRVTIMYCICFILIILYSFTIYGCFNQKQRGTIISVASQLIEQTEQIEMVSVACILIYIDDQ
jgi:hypothetical protein